MVVNIPPDLLNLLPNVVLLCHVVLRIRMMLGKRGKKHTRTITILEWRLLYFGY